MAALFIAHGRKHARKAIFPPLVSDPRLFDAGVYVDVNPACDPTFVADVRVPGIEPWGTLARRFDFVFVMAVLSGVLLAPEFWLNVRRWLKPGGVVMSILPRVALFEAGGRARDEAGRAVLDKAAFNLRVARATGLVIDAVPGADLALHAPRSLFART